MPPAAHPTTSSSNSSTANRSWWRVLTCAAAASLLASATDRIVFGVQSVRWAGGRREWNAALRLAGPIARAIK